MNIPLLPNEESTKMEASKTKTKEDAMEVKHALSPTEVRASNMKKDAYDEYSSSSGDEEEDDDDDDDEGGDPNINSKIAGGTTSNTPDGASSVLQIPLRYTKSGRKRSIPFPVRVSV